MEQITDFPYDVIENPDMGIMMPDGCRLSARVWMPKDAATNPVPAILEHIPYRKRDGTIVRDEYTHPWFAGNGYACIRVDMRGNGESEGLMEDEYIAQELQDACDVIAWAASQDWCNGNVGMMGISWGGFNGLQVASLQPPALKAIITCCSTVDRYADDIHYKGGCLLGENFGWATNMLSYSSRPPDPVLVGDENWLDMWKHRLENMPYNWREWFAHQHRNDYWKHGSVCEDYASIKAAVLSIGGWHDGYRNTISHLVENLSAPVKGIVGPWNHKYPHYAGPKPAIGFLQEAKRWWDRWLKDEPTGVEDDPAYRVYLMDSVAPKRWFDERPGRWIAEQEWPSQNIATKKLHLCNEGLADTATKIDIKISSPQDCGMASGEYFPFAFGDELPDEQSFDDERSLCFDTEKMADACDIVGAPIIKLSVTADKPNAQLCVRLCDLRPDGTSALITFGVINLTHHRSDQEPNALIEGQKIDVKFALDQIGYRVPKGHKLRLAVSTSYWPVIWPSPEQAEISLNEGSIEIPIRSTAVDDEWHFEPPQAATAWQAIELRPTSYSRQVKSEGGKTILDIVCDNGENRDRQHALISGSWFKERWEISPDDPNSANVSIEWEQTGGRKGQMWRTSVVTKMWSDKLNFYSEAKLICFLNNELFFEKEYSEKAVRNLV